MANKKYKFPKLSKSMSYKTYLEQEVTNKCFNLSVNHFVRPPANHPVLKLYELKSGYELAKMDAVIVTISYDKKIIAHACLDKEFYLKTVKATDREATDDMLESAYLNFLYPLETALNAT